MADRAQREQESREKVDDKFTEQRQDEREDRARVAERIEEEEPTTDEE
jgi:hypothetical protein